MRRFIVIMLSVVSILILSSAKADKPADYVYLDGGGSKTALILCHGKGKHPTWKVVDPLRKAVNQKLGYHSLSLQMPNRDTTWKNYAEDFPESYKMIKDGIRYLKKEKGVTTIYLMGHSMGARMASAFVANYTQRSIVGLIVVGCRNNGGPPLSCKENLRKLNIPVLDIWGSKKKKDSNAAREREKLVSKHYRQEEISGANHTMDGYEDEFVASVVKWIKTQE